MKTTLQARVIMFFRLCFSLFFLYALLACSPKTREDLQVEIDFEVKKLVAELKEVESKEEIERKGILLRKKWSHIADLLLKVEGSALVPRPATASSEALFIEMARIYEIPGGKEALESTQTEAVAKIYEAGKFYPAK